MKKVLLLFYLVFVCNSINGFFGFLNNSTVSIPNNYLEFTSPLENEAQLKEAVIALKYLKDRRDNMIKNMHEKDQGLIQLLAQFNNKCQEYTRSCSSQPEAANQKEINNYLEQLSMILKWFEIKKSELMETRHRIIKLADIIDHFVNHHEEEAQNEDHDFHASEFED